MWYQVDVHLCLYVQGLTVYVTYKLLLTISSDMLKLSKKYVDIHFMIVLSLIYTKIVKILLPL